jgi:hypothetical protein
MNVLYLDLADVVGVDVVTYGMLVHHVGIVVGEDAWGEVLVVSKSRTRGGVVEETLEQFSGGRGWTYHPELRGRLPGWLVADRARRRLGERWRAGSNCEHFVREVHGLPSDSPQLQRMLALGGATAMSVAAMSVMAVPLAPALTLSVLGGALLSRRR